MGPSDKNPEVDVTGKCSAQKAAILPDIYISKIGKGASIPDSFIDGSACSQSDFIRS